MIKPDLRKQRGAALIIVLLLVATLSVIAISLTDQTIVAAARGRNEANRTQMFWRMLGAQTLATNLLSDALSSSSNASVMSIDDIWAAQPFDLAVLAENEGERGEIRFADATRCYNLNGLDVDRSASSGGSTAPASGPTTGAGPGRTPAQIALDEFIAVLTSIGISQSDARALGVRVRDWVDEDVNPGPDGAEDETYQRLPVPYRTGNTLLSDKSELRAILGVDPVFLSAIAPLVCTHPTADPSVVNINMLRPLDAPVLVGVFDGAITLNDAETLIERRPLGGYQTVAEVMSSPIIASMPAAARALANDRIDVRSNYLNARLNLEFGKTILEVTMLFRVSSANRLELISRRIGSDV